MTADYVHITKFIGYVTQGRRIGTKIGFPTANIRPETENINLELGVYAVTVTIDERLLLGIMNVGIRPTFQERNKAINYEVHILDFNENLYNQKISVDVLFFVRKEKAFSSVDELKLQIASDIQLVESRMSSKFTKN